MSQNYYKLYIDSVYELANTIVIKSDYSADTINDWIKFTYGQDAVDPYDKTTWKYYLNLAGRYHPLDTIIYVTSLDNLAKITFDRTTLENHPATLEAYRYGSRYYTELVTLHPEMEQFIIGCLYPIDLDSAVDAVDGSVLSYPSHLIEENEESLIPNIEKWISQFNIRWTNSQFNLTDSLYAAANLGLLYLNLIPLIINLRLQACKTREAHSYHIRQYLASHGFLDTYIDYLNLKQRLFLYRNIRYIQRNNGKRETFAWLVDKLLTERNIPLAEHTMKHDVSNIVNDYYPKIGFRRKSINNIYSPNGNTRPVISLDEMLAREENLAVGNREYVLDTRKKIGTTFENSLSSVVATKVLESSVVDYTDSETYSLTDVRLCNWLHSASLNKYEAVISFKEPVTSVDKTLNAFDAYLYWFYCYCKSLDIHLVEIPELFFYKAVQAAPVLRSDLETLVDQKYIPSETIDDILATRVEIPTMPSVSSFSNFVNDIYDNFKLQLRIISNEENYFGRGLVQNMANRLYENKRIDTKAVLLSKDGQEYTSLNAWLETKGLSTTDYTKDQYKDLYLELFKNATGADYLTAKTLAELQKALLRLLSELSSYSIQILSDINDTNIRKLGWGSIRVSGFQFTESTVHEVLIPTIRPEIIEYHTFDEVHVPVIPITEGVNFTTHSSEVHEIEIKVKAYSDFIYTHQVNVGKLSVNPCFGFDPNFVGGISTLDAYQSFYSLSPEDQLLVRDVYTNIAPIDLTLNKIDLNTAVYRNVLSSFETLSISKNKLTAFVYKYIPRTTVNGVKISYASDLAAFLPNLGRMDLNAYRLFNQEQVANLFTLYASTGVGDGFVPNFGSTITHPTYLHTQLNFGKDLEFVQSFLGTGVYNHPSLPGQVFNGFTVVTNSETSEYNLVGFSYNGTQLTWS